MRKTLVYLPLDKNMAKKNNLPLKLPVLIEDMENLKNENKISLEVILRGLRAQCSVKNEDDYYFSYLIYFLYEEIKKLISLKQHEKAFQIIEELKSKRIDDFRINLYSGILFKETGEAGKAEREFREAVKKNESSPFAGFELGKLLLDSDELEEAAEIFASVLSKNPDFLPAILSSGDLLFKKGDLDAASRFYKKIIFLSPKSLPAYSRLGVLYNYEGSFSEAEKIFKKAEEIFPNDFEIKYNYSYTLLNLSKPLEALEKLKIGSEINPAFPSVFNEAGIIKKNIGFFVDSEKDLKKAFELSEGDVEIRKNLILSSLLNRDYLLAKELLMRPDMKTFSSKEVFLELIEEDMKILDENRFSITAFCKWVRNSYSELEPDFLEKTHIIEEGFFPVIEFVKSANLEYLPLFIDIFEEFHEFRLETVRALTQFSSFITNSTEWVAFSHCTLYLFLNGGFDDDQDFSDTIGMLVEEAKKGDYSFAKRIREIDSEKMSRMEDKTEKKPSDLFEFLEYLLYFLWANFSVGEIEISSYYSEDLVRIYKLLQNN